MRQIINFIILLPLLLFLILILFNTHLLSTNESISIFGITEINIPVLGFVSIFFALYLLLVYLFFKFSNVFVAYRNKKLETEINKLKSKLYEERPKLVEDLKNEFNNILEKFKTEKDLEIKAYKKENEKVLSNVEYEIKTIKDKLDKLKK